MRTRYYVDIIVLWVLFMTALSLSWEDKTVTGLLTAGDSIPAGFGAPYDVFADAHPQIIQASYSNGKINIRADATYIWKTGYYWDYNAKAFKPFTFSGTTGSATGIVDNPSGLRNGINYIIAYTCNKVNNIWKCGCSSTTNCNMWQLQSFEYSSMANPTITVGTASGKIGDTVEVPITFDPAGGQAGRMEFTLKFDKTKVSFVSGSSGSSAISAGDSVGVSENPGGTFDVHINDYLANPKLIPSGEIAKVKFKILTGASGNIAISKSTDPVSVIDMDSKDISSTLAITDGAIIVGGGGTSGVSVTTRETSAKPGDKITVSWSGRTAPASTDWIALVKTGERWTTGSGWEWYFNSETKSSGSKVFTVPIGMQSIQFVYYDFVGGTWTELGKSPAIPISSSSECSLVSAEWEIPTTGGTANVVAKHLPITGAAVGITGNYVVDSSAPCETNTNVGNTKTTGGQEYMCYRVADASKNPGWVPTSQEICVSTGSSGEAVISTAQVSSGGCHAQGKSVVDPFYNALEAGLQRLPVVTALDVSGCATIGTGGSGCILGTATDFNSGYYDLKHVPGNGAFWVTLNLKSGASDYPKTEPVQFSTAYARVEGTERCTSYLGGTEETLNCPYLDYTGEDSTAISFETRWLRFIKTSQEVNGVVPGQLLPGKVRITSIQPGSDPRLSGRAESIGGDQSGPFDLLTIAPPPVISTLKAAVTSNSGTDNINVKKGETITVTGLHLNDREGLVSGGGPHWYHYHSDVDDSSVGRGIIIFDLNRNAFATGDHIYKLGDKESQGTGIWGIPPQDSYTYSQAIYYCDDTKIQFNVPNYLSGTHTVTFFNVFGVSNKMNIVIASGSVAPTPDLKCEIPFSDMFQLDPAEGAIGSIVRLVGGGFYSPNTVTFNGVPATDIPIQGNSEIQVRVPNGATTGPVVVTTAHGTVMTGPTFTVKAGQGGSGVKAGTAVNAKVTTSGTCTGYKIEFTAKDSAGKTVSSPSSITSITSTVKSSWTVPAYMPGQDSANKYRFDAVLKDSSGNVKGTQTSNLLLVIP